MILVDKQKTTKLLPGFAAKISTSFWSFLIIIALFYFYATLSEQTRELTNFRVKKEGDIIKIGENIYNLQAKAINTKTIQSILAEKQMNSKKN